MKLNHSEIASVKGKRLLILSDGKPGHENQSIAFARHLGYDYDLSRVNFRSRLGKGCSYLLDRARIYSAGLFNAEIEHGEYVAVVAAGSGTYYPCRTLAKRLRCKSVAIMLPKGYQLDFDIIIAQEHDEPPVLTNVISLPVNLSYVEPQGMVKPQVGKKYIALIVGGDSRHGLLDPQRLRVQIEQIFMLFPQHDFWLTTSRRTSSEVEAVLRKFNWTRAVYVSQEPMNPIPDFLAHSDYVLITADSTSMISEAVSYGSSCVEILPPVDNFIPRGKLGQMISALQKRNSLHLFDGTVSHMNEKIELASLLREVVL